jgi:VanZ family protein
LRKLFAVLFFTWLAALLALTYYPDFPNLKLRVRDEWFRLDYLGHLGFYAVLTALFLLWRTGWRKKVSLKLLILTILSGFVLGALTELTQLAIPGRSMNPVDLVYNCAGILVGAGTVALTGRRENKRK